MPLSPRPGRRTVSQVTGRIRAAEGRTTVAMASAISLASCDVCARGVGHEWVLAAFGRVFLTEEDGRRSRLCSLKCLGFHLREVRRRYRLTNHPTPSRLW